MHIMNKLEENGVKTSEVLIPRNKNNKPKGYALVELKNLADLNKVLNLKHL